MKKKEKTLNTCTFIYALQIDDMNLQIQRAERQYDLRYAAELKYRTIGSLEQQLREAEEELNKLRGSRNSMLRGEVTENDIAEVVSNWTGIPVSKLQQSQKEKLLKSEEELHRRVVGQDLAVKASNVQEPVSPIPAAPSLASCLWDQQV